MQDWANRNLPVALWVAIAGIILFSLSAYIKKEVGENGKNYLPTAVWSQWAGERGEWRGKIEEKLDRYEKDRATDREEFQKQLNGFDKKLDRVILLLDQHTKATGEKPTAGGLYP